MTPPMYADSAQYWEAASEDATVSGGMVRVKP